MTFCSIAGTGFALWSATCRCVPRQHLRYAHCSCGLPPGRLGRCRRHPPWRCSGVPDCCWLFAKNRTFSPHSRVGQRSLVLRLYSQVRVPRPLWGLAVPRGAEESDLAAVLASRRSTSQTLMIDCRVTPIRAASRSRDSTTHAGKSTLIRFWSWFIRRAVERSRSPRMSSFPSSNFP